MALVSTIDGEGRKYGGCKHSLVSRARSFYFVDEGMPILQLDTYGTGERQNVGTVSQTFQLTQDAAVILIRHCVAAFPGILEILNKG